MTEWLSSAEIQLREGSFPLPYYICANPVLLSDDTIATVSTYDPSVYLEDGWPYAATGTSLGIVKGSYRETPSIQRVDKTKQGVNASIGSRWTDKKVAISAELTFTARESIINLLQSAAGVDDSGRYLGNPVTPPLFTFAAFFKNKYKEGVFDVHLFWAVEFTPPEYIADPETPQFVKMEAIAHVGMKNGCFRNIGMQHSREYKINSAGQLVDKNGTVITGTNIDPYPALNMSNMIG